MKKSDNISAKKMIYIFIIVVGIVELLYLLKTRQTGFHVFAMFIGCVFTTIIGFFKDDEYKWCEFGLLVVYLTLTIISIYAF